MFVMKQTDYLVQPELRATSLDKDVTSFPLSSFASLFSYFQSKKKKSTYRGSLYNSAFELQSEYTLSNKKVKLNKLKRLPHQGSGRVLDFGLGLPLMMESGS